MPYKLRKAPKRELYWVVNKETGKKYSKEPLPKDRALAQMRALYASESSLEGGAIHKGILQQMAQSAYTGKTRPRIGNFTLIFATPTMKFYKENDGKLIVTAIRGTRLNDKEDIAADVAAFVGKLRDTSRYRKDKEAIEKVQQHFPRPEYRYIAVGHSLGGAILDLLLRDGLIQNGMSYNPLVEPQEMGGTPHHHRIYHKDDPLYALFGHKIPNVEVRTTAEPFWKYAMQHLLPGPLGDLFKYYDRHKIRIFKGGAVRPSAGLKDQLEDIELPAREYMKGVREHADAHGYDPADVSFSDNDVNKVQIVTPAKKTVRFGRVGYNDFHMWNHLEKEGEVPAGTAEQKRDRFWKSHSKIAGDWKADDYSPNWLAMRVLW